MCHGPAKNEYRCHDFLKKNLQILRPGSSNRIDRRLHFNAMMGSADSVILFNMNQLDIAC